MSQQPKIDLEDNKQEEEVDQPGAPKLSKNQKKKLKEQAKKQAEKLQAEAGGDKKQDNIGAPKQETKKQDKKKGKPNAAAMMALKLAEKKRQEQQEYERQKKQFEQEQKRLEQIEKEKERVAAQKKAIEKKLKQEQKKRLKQQGLYKTKKDKKRQQRDKMVKQDIEKMKQLDSNDESSSDDDDNETQNVQQKQIQKVASVQQKPVVEKQPPKKKFIKKKQQTLQQIYKQAMQKKAAQAARIAEGGIPNVDNWEQMNTDKKVEEAKVIQPSEDKKVQESKKTQNPVTAQQTPAQKQKRQKKQKKDKKKKQKQVEPQPEKKKEPQLEILIDKKKYFAVDQNQKYRSPICCILGHVDTGKTSILDKIRRTSVQENQAGGITQQIGATFFPKDKLVQQVVKCNSHYPIEANVPGLLIIDTPGHESFSNLRSRGSSLCDIAILVIDLMHGLEKQTLQSIKMLTDRGTHFVVALNKIDRSYQWISAPDSSSYVSLKAQSGPTVQDYTNRLNQVKLQLNQEGFNIAMYWQNQDINQYVSLIPTSAKTGEGLPDLMSALVKQCMSIPSIQKRLRIDNKKFNCTVMQVKMIQGHGTTIDCVLVDGVIHRNDQIVLLGFNGPIVTKVKALLTPHPMKEMRVKDEYIHHDFMRAANGIKIDAPGIDSAVAGTPLFVANTQEQVQRAIKLCNRQYQQIKNKIKLSDMGVGVAASTLGSLQALLDYLGSQKIPVSNVSVGPVSKEDVMKAMKSLLSQNPEKRRKEYCCVLVFDVKILDDAKKYAEQNNIRIFWADIIYHLTDHFNKYVKQVKQERKQKQGKDAIFPCTLKVIEIFRKNDPIVLGVDVEQGVLKVGTPLSVYNKEGVKLKIGVVQSIESNHKKIKQARKVSGSVAVAIVGQKVTAGKDFLQADKSDKLCSLISRRSIDCLKEHYRDDVSKDQWQLVIELKKYLGVQ